MDNIQHVWDFNYKKTRNNGYNLLAMKHSFKSSLGQGDVALLCVFLGSCTHVISTPQLSTEMPGKTDKSLRRYFWCTRFDCYQAIE